VSLHNLAIQLTKSWQSIRKYFLYYSTAVANMLSQVDNSRLIKKGVKQAAKIGKKGKPGQCKKSYPNCPASEKSPSYASLALMLG